MGAETVCRLLPELGSSVQLPRKSRAGTSPPPREAQFRSINTQGQALRDQPAPVIAVEAKQREFVGEVKTGGQEWRKKGQPGVVNADDFRRLSSGVAIP